MAEPRLSEVCISTAKASLLNAVDTPTTVVSERVKISVPETTASVANRFSILQCHLRAVSRDRGLRVFLLRP